jgi:excisionase family DNA binding protein
MADLLTTAEAAAYLRKAKKTFAYNWHRYGLHPSRVGNRNLFHKSELDAYLRDGRISEPTRVN